MAFFLIIFLYFLWTLSFPLGKIGVMYASPLFFTGIRMLFAGILLLGYLRWKKISFPNDRKTWIGIFLIALLPVYLTNAFEFWSLSQIASSKVCFIYSLCPFITAILSYFHLNETMTKKKIFGMMLGFLGFIPMLFQDGDIRSSNFFSVRLPELAMILASIGSVYGFIIMKKLIQKNTSILFVNGASMLLGSIFCFLHSLFTNASNLFPIQSGKISYVLGICALLTLISNIVCYNLYGILLKRFSTTLLSFAGLISPFFASLHGYFLLGEKPSLLLFGCMGIISFGLWLVYQDELKRKAIISG